MICKRCGTNLLPINSYLHNGYCPICYDIINNPFKEEQNINGVL